MLEADAVLEAQLGGLARETGDRDAIAERVVNPAKPRRLRHDADVRLQQVLVVTLVRPEHHAVLAERHRLAVAIGRDVADGQDRHRSGKRRWTSATSKQEKGRLARR